jgi:hypothetical protein
MVERQYTELIQLAEYVGVDLLLEIDKQICHEMGIDRGDVRLHTADGHIDCEGLAEALAEVDEAETVTSLQAWYPRAVAEFRVYLSWDPEASAVSRIQVRGADQTRVLGFAEALRRFVARNAPKPDDEPAVPSVVLDPAAQTRAVQRRQALDGRAGEMVRELTDLARPSRDGQLVEPAVSTLPPKPPSRWHRLGAWCRRNSTAFYISVAGSVVAAALVAVWAFVVG